MLLSQEIVQQAINKSPTLPVAVLKALELLGHNEVDFTLLRETITCDPALASRVLSVANSPFYGMEGQVGNLSEAFMVLGTHTIRNIVLAAGVVGTFPPREGVNFKYLELWQHAVGTAVCAKIFARLTHQDQETALIAGLLNDIGKMFLDAYFGDEYSQALQQRDKEDCLLYEAEEAVLGINHGQVGALLIERWHLPEEIVTVAREHYHPSEGNSSPLNDLIHISDIVCRGLDIGDAGDSLIPELDPQALVRLGLDIEQLSQHFAEIEKDTNASVALLN